MEKPNPNISLAAAAELRRSGLWLSLQKGINELFRPQKTKTVRTPVPIPESGGRPLRLSLIICTAGTCPGLPDAVASALRQEGAPAYEVLVVWNRPDSPPAGLLPAEARWVREARPGLSRARNCGAVHAKGSLLLYMDDDAVADSGLVRSMAAAFVRRPQAAIVGGQIRLALPTPRPEAVLPGREGLWSAYTVPFRSYRPVRGQYEFPYGACFCIRAAALEALGGFPSSYGRIRDGFEGGEETALCFLAQSRGWEVGIQPAAWVEHRVEPRRFTRTHVKNTLRAGIFTTYRLCRDGYAPWDWDLRYVRERMRIADRELRRLEHRGSELERYYKKCERDAFAELFLALQRPDQKEVLPC